MTLLQWRSRNAPDRVAPDDPGTPAEDGPGVRAVSLDLLPSLDTTPQATGPGLVELEFAVRAWTDACAAVAVRDRSEMLTLIFNRHHEPHRTAHDRGRLSEVVFEVLSLAGDESLDRVERAVAVFAAFFQDIVLEPGAPDNEFQSAEAAREMLFELGLPRHLIDRVARAVNCTAAHHADTPESRVLVDADLAIYASDRFTYDVFADALRAEASHLTDLEWATARRRVVDRLLERPSIFLTGSARELYEEKARVNLRRELAELSR